MCKYLSKAVLYRVRGWGLQCWRKYYIKEQSLIGHAGRVFMQGCSQRGEVKNASIFLEARTPRIWNQISGSKIPPAQFSHPFPHLLRAVLPAAVSAACRGASAALGDWECPEQLECCELSLQPNLELLGLSLGSLERLACATFREAQWDEKLQLTNAKKKNPFFFFSSCLKNSPGWLSWGAVTVAEIPH